MTEQLDNERPFTTADVAEFAGSLGIRSGIALIEMNYPGRSMVTEEGRVLVHGSKRDDNGSADIFFEPRDYTPRDTMP